MPTGGERTRFRFPIADHTAGDQIRIVKSRAIRVSNGIAQLAAFVDRTWRFRCAMAGDPAGKRKLLEQPPPPLFVFAYVRIKLAVRAFEVCIRHNSRSAVPRTRNVDDVEILALDHAIQVHVYEIQSGRSAPMAEQAWLNVFRF